MKTTPTIKHKTALQAMVPVRLPDLNHLFPKRVIADRVRAILQLIFYVEQHLQRNESFAPGVDRSAGFCPISAETLRAIAGKNYRAIITQMIAHGIIEVKRSELSGREAYYPHKYTKLYRIVSKWKEPLPNGRSYRREQITHPDVVRAIATHYGRSYKNQLKLVASKGKVYADIVRYGEQFTIDMKRLERDVHEGKLPNGENLLTHAVTFNEKLIRFCAVDSFAGRLHTHLGSLPKLLRPYLVLESRPETQLVLVDCRNFQPYAISVLFYKPSLLNLVPEFLPIKYKLEAQQKHPATWMLYRDCYEGRFYQTCLTALSGTDQEITEDEKAELKQQLFRYVFFSSPGNYHLDPQLKLERQEVENKISLVYPSLVKGLIALKRTRRDELPFVYELSKKGKKGGRMYVLPSMLLQRFESKVLLHIVAATLQSLNINLYSVHDAFLIEASNLDALKQVFNQVFKEQLGVEPPQLHVTELTQSTTL